MITIMMYTYRHDAEIAKVSLRQMRKVFPKNRIVVIDDAHAPMEKQATEVIRSLGVDVIYSTHNRDGNLKGVEHTLYHAQKMCELAPTPDDIVLKIDPDTLLFDTQWITDFERSEDAVLSGAFKIHIAYIMGMAYAVKGKILKEYLQDVQDYPSWLKSLEDYEVSSRIYRLTKRDPFACMRYQLGARDGWYLCNYSQAFTEKHLLETCKVFNGGYYNRANEKMNKSYEEFCRRLVSMREQTTQTVIGSKGTSFVLSKDTPS